MFGDQNAGRFLQDFLNLFFPYFPTKVLVVFAYLYKAPLWQKQRQRYYKTVIDIH